MEYNSILILSVCFLIWMLVGFWIIYTKDPIENIENRLKLYKEIKKCIITDNLNGKDYYCFCPYIADITKGNITISELKELIKHKPKGVKNYLYWFEPNDYDSRITIINKCILETRNKLEKFHD